VSAPACCLRLILPTAPRLLYRFLPLFTPCATPPRGPELLVPDFPRTAVNDLCFDVPPLPPQSSFSIFSDPPSPGRPLSSRPHPPLKSSPLPQSNIDLHHPAPVTHRPFFGTTLPSCVLFGQTDECRASSQSALSGYFVSSPFSPVRCFSSEC